MAIVRYGAANDNRETTAEQLTVSIEAAIDRNLTDGDISFGTLESLLLRVTNEAVRRCLQRRLQTLADELGDELMVGRHRYKRHHPGRVKYFSLCGAMEVDRWTYRRVQERNGKTIVALDRVAGIAQGATPALAFAIAQGVAKAPVRSVEEDLIAAFRSPPSRSKMDRIGRALGRQVDATVEEIEPRLRQREQLPSGAKAINLGIDRTTIPMEESTEAEAKPSKLRFVKGFGATTRVEESNEKAKLVVRYRMGYVATFCITDKDCEPLVTRRYAAPAHEGPARILARLKADLEHALKQNPKLTIGVVQDGAPEMWNLMRDMLDSIPRLARPRRMGVPRHWKETIDRYHLMEKLSQVLELLLPKEAQLRSEIYAAWNTDLDRHSGAIRRIEKWIDDRRYKASRRVQDEIHRLLGNYFVCPQHFRYAELAPLGLHQGSGVTEGACKSLITMRAKRSGQRWRPIGITSVLAIRSLLESDRLAAFWKHFARRFIAPIKNAA
jgi:hypothetical protein